MDGSECRCLVCGCCAGDHAGWAHPWTGDVELLLTAAAEAIRQTWRGNRKCGAVADSVGELACDLLRERTK